MPIFFGWGHTTKKLFGPVFKQVCNHCHNEEYWVLTRIRVWFTLFFIPVIPYENKYFLSCPICEYGLTLNTEQIQQLRPVAEANQLLVSGAISEAEYSSRVRALNSGEVTTPQEVVAVRDVEVETQTSEQDNQSRQFCSECGNKVIAEAKFCGKCGTSTSK